MKSRKEKEDKLKGWLFGWKEIGEYLGCSEKTVLTYTKKNNLPVRRLPETNKPIASPSEIDNWIRTYKIGVNIP